VNLRGDHRIVGPLIAAGRARRSLGADLALRQVQDPEAAVIAQAAGAAAYRETFHIAWAEAQSPTREVLRAAQAAASEAAANAYQATYDQEITLKEATR
jgi:hypothetical protein